MVGECQRWVVGTPAIAMLSRGDAARGEEAGRDRDVALEARHQHGSEARRPDRRWPRGGVGAIAQLTQRVVPPAHYHRIHLGVRLRGGREGGVGSSPHPMAACARRRGSSPEPTRACPAATHSGVLRRCDALARRYGGSHGMHLLPVSVAALWLKARRAVAENSARRRPITRNARLPGTGSSARPGLIAPVHARR